MRLVNAIATTAASTVVCVIRTTRAERRCRCHRPHRVVGMSHEPERNGVSDRRFEISTSRPSIETADGCAAVLVSSSPSRAGTSNR